MSSRSPASTRKVVVSLYQLCDSGILECDRGIHIGCLMECKNAAEPAQRPAGTAREKVFGKTPFPACLRKGEIILGEKILIESHIVVQVLDR